MVFENTPVGAATERVTKHYKGCIDRRAFMKTMLGGVFYVSNANAPHPHRDFLTGDSMAHKWTRPRTYKAAYPGSTIREIATKCSDFLHHHSNRDFDTVLLFAGTADCLYPPGQSMRTLLFKKELDITKRTRMVNSREKCEQVCSDMQMLRDVLIKELSFKQLITIGPFPAGWLDNYELIERVDERLSQAIPDYVILSRDFFDFENRNRLDDSWFRDNLHLNGKGYRRLERLIDTQNLPA